MARLSVPVLLTNRADTCHDELVDPKSVTNSPCNNNNTELVLIYAHNIMFD